MNLARLAPGLSGCFVLHTFCHVSRVLARLMLPFVAQDRDILCRRLCWPRWRKAAATRGCVHKYSSLLARSSEKPSVTVSDALLCVTLAPTTQRLTAHAPCPMSDSVVHDDCISLAIARCHCLLVSRARRIVFASST